MIRFWIEKKNRSWLESTALLVLGALLFSIVAPPYAEASIWDERKKAVDVMTEKKEKVAEALKKTDKSLEEKERIKELGIASGIEIPEDLGTVVEAWGGIPNLAEQPPLVIHIQDAHGVYDAQKNASEILKIIRSGNQEDKEAASVQPLLVCVEGAWGRVSPEWISVFPDENLKKEMAERLLQEGEITGEEYLAIMMGPGKLKIYGVEEKELYEANAKAREVIDRDRKNLLEELEKLSFRLDAIKRKIYPRKLLELDHVSGNFETQKIPLKEYFSYLLKADPQSWKNQDYPNLTSLEDMVKLEAQFTKEGIEEERKKLLIFLEDKLDKSSLAQLGQVSLSYRLGKISGERFYEGIIHLAEAHNKELPQIKIYVNYLKKYSAIKTEKLSDEIIKLEKNVFLSFAGKDEKLKKLVEVDRGLRIETKFWDEKLSPTDWEDYRQTVKKGDLKNFSGKVLGWKEIEKFVFQKEKDLRLEVSQAHQPSKISRAQTPTYAQMRYLQEGYYRLAFKRDQTMVEKTLEKAKELNEERVVLIAGGFHTAGMMKFLRDKGVPYIVIRPKLSFERAQKQEKKDKSDKRKGIEKVKYASLIGAYTKKLEELKSDLETNVQGQDQELAEAVEKVMDIIKNKLFFVGPVEDKGNNILLGAYQGEFSRVNFLIESSDFEPAPPVVSVEFENAIEQAMGTLRSKPGSFGEEGVVRIFSGLSFWLQTGMERAGHLSFRKAKKEDSERLEPYSKEVWPYSNIQRKVPPERAGPKQLSKASPQPLKKEVAALPTLKQKIFSHIAAASGIAALFVIAVLASMFPPIAKVSEQTSLQSLEIQTGMIGMGFIFSRLQMNPKQIILFLLGIVTLFSVFSQPPQVQKKNSRFIAPSVEASAMQTPPPLSNFGFFSFQAPTRQPESQVPTQQPAPAPSVVVSPSQALNSLDQILPQASGSEVIDAMVKAAHDLETEKVKLLDDLIRNSRFSYNVEDVLVIRNLISSGRFPFNVPPSNIRMNQGYNVASITKVQVAYNADFDPGSWGIADAAHNGLHEGIDIFSASDAPVVALMSGRISKVVSVPNSGIHVTVDLGASYSHYQTVYRHLANPVVMENDSVQTGLLISHNLYPNPENTAPHIHFELRRADSTPIDPYPLLQVLSVTNDPRIGLSRMVIEIENLRMQIKNAAKGSKENLDKVKAKNKQYQEEVKILQGLWSSVQSGKFPQIKALKNKIKDLAQLEIELQKEIEKLRSNLTTAAQVKNDADQKIKNKFPPEIAKTPEGDETLTLMKRETENALSHLTAENRSLELGINDLETTLASVEIAKKESDKLFKAQLEIQKIAPDLADYLRGIALTRIVHNRVSALAYQMHETKDLWAMDIGDFVDRMRVIQDETRLRIQELEMIVNSSKLLAKRINLQTIENQSLRSELSSLLIETGSQLDRNLKSSKWRAEIILKPTLKELTWNLKISRLRNIGMWIFFGFLPILGALLLNFLRRERSNSLDEEEFEDAGDIDEAGGREEIGAPTNGATPAAPGGRAAATVTGVAGEAGKAAITVSGRSGAGVVLDIEDKGKEDQAVGEKKLVIVGGSQGRVDRSDENVNKGAAAPSPSPSPSSNSEGVEPAVSVTEALNNLYGFSQATDSEEVGAVPAVSGSGSIFSRFADRVKNLFGGGTVTPAPAPSVVVTPRVVGWERNEEGLKRALEAGDGAIFGMGSLNEGIMQRIIGLGGDRYENLKRMGRAELEIPGVEREYQEDARAELLSRINQRFNLDLLEELKVNAPQDVLSQVQINRNRKEKFIQDLNEMNPAFLALFPESGFRNQILQSIRSEGDRFKYLSSIFSMQEPKLINGSANVQELEEYFYVVTLRIENQYGLLIPGSRRALDKLLNLLHRGHPREIGIDSALDVRVLKAVREGGIHNEFKTLGKIINGEKELPDLGNIEITPHQLKLYITALSQHLENIYGFKAEKKKSSGIITGGGLGGLLGSVIAGLILIPISLLTQGFVPLVVDPVMGNTILLTLFGGFVGGIGLWIYKEKKAKGGAGTATTASGSSATAAAAPAPAASAPVATPQAAPAASGGIPAASPAAPAAGVTPTATVTPAATPAVPSASAGGTSAGGTVTPTQSAVPATPAPGGVPATPTSATSAGTPAAGSAVAAVPVTPAVSGSGSIFSRFADRVKNLFGGGKVTPAPAAVATPKIIGWERSEEGLRRALEAGDKEIFGMGSLNEGIMQGLIGLGGDRYENLKRMGRGEIEVIGVENEYQAEAREELLSKIRGRFGIDLLKEPEVVKAEDMVMKGNKGEWERNEKGLRGALAAEDEVIFGFEPLVNELIMTTIINSGVDRLQSLEEIIRGDRDIVGLDIKYMKAVRNDLGRVVHKNFNYEIREIEYFIREMKGGRNVLRVGSPVDEGVMELLRKGRDGEEKRILSRVMSGRVKIPGVREEEQVEARNEVRKVLRENYGFKGIDTGGGLGIFGTTLGMVLIPVSQLLGGAWGDSTVGNAIFLALLGIAAGGIGIAFILRKKEMIVLEDGKKTIKDIADLIKELRNGNAKALGIGTPVDEGVMNLIQNSKEGKENNILEKIIFGKIRIPGVSQDRQQEARDYLARRLEADFNFKVDLKHGQLMEDREKIGVEKLEEELLRKNWSVFGLDDKIGQAIYEEIGKSGYMLLNLENILSGKISLPGVEIERQAEALKDLSRKLKLDFGFEIGSFEKYKKPFFVTLEQRRMSDPSGIVKPVRVTRTERMFGMGIIKPAAAQFTHGQRSPIIEFPDVRERMGYIAREINQTSFSSLFLIILGRFLSILERPFREVEEIDLGFKAPQGLPARGLKGSTSKLSSLGTGALKPAILERVIPRAAKTTVLTFAAPETKIPESTKTSVLKPVVERGAVTAAKTGVFERDRACKISRHIKIASSKRSAGCC
ncbi:MAG: peptidoglycan DD-metalloendopeptidase family protein [Elusimicrobia bacterium]|nr:peptidoglycan DD-metalloendopeptidase family protein [Elusimicrobiota bacterium]